MTEAKFTKAEIDDTKKPSKEGLLVISSAPTEVDRNSIPHFTEAEILEIIGEDEKLDSINFYRINIRNELRTEQRQALAKLVEDKKP